MRKELTPQEKEIIRETQRLGEEEAARNPNPKGGRGQMWKSLAIFALAFGLMALMAYLFMVVAN